MEHETLTDALVLAFEDLKNPTSKKIAILLCEEPNSEAIVESVEEIIRRLSEKVHSTISIGTIIMTLNTFANISNKIQRIKWLREFTGRGSKHISLRVAKDFVEALDPGSCGEGFVPNPEARNDFRNALTEMGWEILG